VVAVSPEKVEKLAYKTFMKKSNPKQIAFFANYTI